MRYSHLKIRQAMPILSANKFTMMQAVLEFLRGHSIIRTFFSSLLKFELMNFCSSTRNSTLQVLAVPGVAERVKYLREIIK